jgi:phosphoglycerate dehydrogenase-like enzyme
VTWPDFDADDPGVGGYLRANGARVELAPKRGNRSSRELAQLLGDAHAAIVSTDPFDARVFASAPRLRAIARVGVGVDSIDLDAATRAGVVVTTTPGANESTTADHTLGLMLAVLRRIPEQDASIRRGEWLRTGPHLAWDLAGATVGLVGFGAIGQLVARRLLGFGTSILVSDPVPPAGELESVVEHVELEELLRRADVVSLHAPLSAASRHLIGAHELGLMRPHAILVNTARGGLVDEAALVDALEAGRLRAAGLDVFEHEPPHSSRLKRLVNVVLTPHTGGVSERSVAEMTHRACRAVIEVLNGRVPEGVVNPQVIGHESAGEPLPRTATGAREAQL